VAAQRRNNGQGREADPVTVDCFYKPFVILCITLINKMHHYGELMKNDMLSTRIDHDTKLAFTHVCEEVGISPSQAIKLFAKAVINYGGIPFELKAKQPNALTVKAIEELEDGKGSKADTVDELFNDFGIGELRNA
jgi:DNA-damage-inducible protein J